jgi:outer membrane protein assembly factor BamB
MVKKCTETWNSLNQNSSHPNRYNESKGLESMSIKNLLLKYKIPLGDLPSYKVDVYTNPIVDEENIYISTTAQIDSKGLPIRNGGEIIVLNKITGKIIWKRKMFDYSGIEDDYTRSLGIYKNFLYFSSGKSVPQSVSPYEKTLKSLFTGILVQPSNKPPHLYCVEKTNGLLLWSVPLCASANHINDIDNWVYNSGSNYSRNSHPKSKSTHSGHWDFFRTIFSTLVLYE